jgi:UDP-GlcNAc:undecaprenyl-phosphate GlcNAc-1-phosphate transferase
MLSTILLAACAFALSFLLTPIIRQLALRNGWVDQPDQKRKMHVVPIPRIGGVPILLAYAGSFGLLFLMGRQGSFVVQDSFPLVWKLLPAALIIFATGLIDDVTGLKPWQKLLGESIAAIIVCFAGVRIEGIAYNDINNFLGVPLTIIWLVGCANAFNLIDGLDGLASGLGLLATLTALVAALLHGDTGLVTATAPLAGALLAFLLFNSNPASIFLGDCGSLSVGFMLGCFGVIWSQKSATVLGITAPLMALSIPLLDMAISIVRRFLRRQPIFGADRGHIHHRLLDRGLSPRRVAILLYSASALGACFSLLQSTTRDPFGALIIPLFCVAVWIGVQYLRYHEFDIVARLVRNNGIRSIVKSHMSFHGYDEALRAANSAEECWHIIRTVACEVGFSQVALRLSDQTYQEQLAEASNQQWILHIPLPESQYVEFMCQFELSAAPVVVAPLADLLHRVLCIKVAEFKANAEAIPKKVIAAAGSVHSHEDTFKIASQTAPN